MNTFYTEYSEFLNHLFPGVKMQKISVNAGFSCPNRDGTIGRKGCIYCNNSTFTPPYCQQPEMSIENQIESGKRFFARKYPEMRYLAYFQSYTNTYGTAERILDLFQRVLACEKVDGIIVGTRPDCIDSRLISHISEINRHHPVIIEFGAETSCDNTLKEINRGHTWQQTCDAVKLVTEAGIHCGLHLIAGLPGESSDRILQSVRDSSELPISTIKIHQLQIIAGSELHRRWVSNSEYVSPLGLDEYLNLCVEMVKIIPSRIAIERFVSQSPANMLIAPKWGLKNYEFTNLLINKLKEKYNR